MSNWNNFTVAGKGLYGAPITASITNASHEPPCVATPPIHQQADDVTEQFAEIMNKTIQEAADAEERCGRAQAENEQLKATQALMEKTIIRIGESMNLDDSDVDISWPDISDPASHFKYLASVEVAVDELQDELERTENRMASHWQLAQAHLDTINEIGSALGCDGDTTKQELLDAVQELNDNSGRMLLSSSDEEDDEDA